MSAAWLAVVLPIYNNPASTLQQLLQSASLSNSRHYFVSIRLAPRLVLWRGSRSCGGPPHPCEFARSQAWNERSREAASGWTDLFIRVR